MREGLLEEEIESLFEKIVDDIEDLVDEELWAEIQGFKYGLAVACFHFSSLLTLLMRELFLEFQIEKMKFRHSLYPPEHERTINLAFSFFFLYKNIFNEILISVFGIGVKNNNNNNLHIWK